MHIIVTNEYLFIKVRPEGDIFVTVCKSSQMAKMQLTA